MHAQEATGLAQPGLEAALAWPQQQDYRHSALISQPWLKPEPKDGSTSDPSTQETHRSSLTARQSRRSSRRSERPPSPFEALLAVSSNARSDLPLAVPAPASLPIPATQGQPTQAAQPQREVPSHRIAASLAQNGTVPPAAVAGAKRERDSPDEHQEGVGTSGGGEMGDTDDSSGNSKRQVFDTYVQEECSGVKEGMRGEGGWGAKSRSAKKARMIWTTELHDRFVSAVNHLGLQNAVPKTILKMMNVEGMTRENVASHLQKYRLHLKRQDGAGGAMPLGNSAEQAASDPAMLTTRGMGQGVPVTQALLMSGRIPAYDAPAMGIPVDQAFGQVSESSCARLAPWLADSLTYPPFPGASSALSCQQSAALQLMSLHTPREQPWTGPGLSEPLQAQISQGLTAASAAAARISKGLAAATASLAAAPNGFPGMLDIAPLDYSPPLPPTFGN